MTTNPSLYVPTDLSDSLDIRLILAGRLSLANVPLRRDRADLATVLGPAQEPSARRPSDGRQEINVR